MIKTKIYSVKSNSGSITGYASTWIRKADSAGDVVRKGAFADSIRQIKASGKKLPLLFNHNHDSLRDYIGTVTELEEDNHGLKFTAVFDDSPDAQKARQLAGDGRLRGVSFAYNVLDEAKVVLEDGTRANELRKLDILEISLVMYPANQDTSIIDVKHSCSNCDNASRVTGLERCNQTLRNMLREEREKRRILELTLQAERLLRE